MLIDFEPVRQKFRDMRSRHPTHKKDINRFETTVEEHIKKYGQLMVLYRQSHRISYQKKAELELEKIVQLMKEFERCEILSFLSKNNQRSD